MPTDFTAHPYLGLIAAAVLDDFRFALARDVTLPQPKPRSLPEPCATAQGRVS